MIGYVIALCCLA